VGPGGVAKVVEQAFRDALHTSLENTLRRYWMSHELHASCVRA
jgi:hypothetical protein